jgi:hypothetical protein
MYILSDCCISKDIFYMGYHSTVGGPTHLVVRVIWTFQTYFSSTVLVNTPQKTLLMFSHVLGSKLWDKKLLVEGVINYWHFDTALPSIKCLNAWFQAVGKKLVVVAGVINY